MQVGGWMRLYGLCLSDMSLTYPEALMGVRIMHAWLSLKPSTIPRRVCGCHGLSDAQTRCSPGHFSPVGETRCSPCPFGTYSSLGAVASCDPCPTVRPFSFLRTLSTAGCMCPAGHACSDKADPVACPADTYSHAGGGACVPCPQFTSSNSGADACLPKCPSSLTLGNP